MTIVHITLGFLGILLFLFGIFTACIIAEAHQGMKRAIANKEYKLASYIWHQQNRAIAQTPLFMLPAVSMGFGLIVILGATSSLPLT